MQVRRFSRLAALALALALPACDSGDGTGPEDTGGDLTGSWSLLTVAGQPLPVTQTFTHPEYGACTASLTEMVASFTAGGVYSETNVESEACPGRPLQVDTASLSGTYTTTGNQLVVEYEGLEDELNFTYTVQGDRFTMRIGTLAYVFDRATL